MIPKVSVIVPVYKAEAYLHRCVDSLLAQTFQDYEILLIDDGSPDKSGIICDEYAAKDNRVRVFHKENGGVSSARQCGIDNALGEYTIHADPDDWVEPTMLEELYKKAKKDDADMVICDYFENRGDDVAMLILNIESLSPHILLKKLLQQELHGATWNKLIRRSCYKKFNIKFPLDIICWEDLYVICNILLNPVKVTYLSNAFYHYDLTINENSIVRKPTMQRLMSQIYFIDYFNKKLDHNTFDEGLYKIKAVTKELSFISELISGKEIKKMYSEINRRYVTERCGSLLHFCLSLSLIGFPLCLSKTIYNLCLKLKTILILLLSVWNL